MKPIATFTVVFLSTCVAFVVSSIWMATNMLCYNENQSLNPVFNTPASVSGLVASALLTLWLAFLIFVELDCKFKLHKKDPNP
jgi:hypothetical protein